MVFENYPTDGSAARGFEIREMRYSMKENFPLIFTVLPGRELRIKIKYEASRFSRAAILRMADLFLAVLERISAAPDVRLADLLGVLAEADRQRQSEGEKRLKDLRMQKFEQVRRKAVRGAGRRAGMTVEAVQGYALSPQQRRVWQWLRAPGMEGARFGAQAAGWLAGELDAGRLERAVRNAVGRHEILRTVYRLLPGMTLPVQVVRPEGGLVLDWRRAASPGEPEEVEAALRELAALPFDPASGPLLRVSVTSLAPDRHLLCLALPALAADGTGALRLLEEIARERAGVGGDAGEVVQYADVAQIFNDLLESEETEEGGSSGTGSTRRPGAAGCRRSLPRTRTAASSPSAWVSRASTRTGAPPPWPAGSGSPSRRSGWPAGRPCWPASPEPQTSCPASRSPAAATRGWRARRGPSPASCRSSAAWTRWRTSSAWPAGSAARWSRPPSGRTTSAGRTWEATPPARRPGSPCSSSRRSPGPRPPAASPRRPGAPAWSLSRSGSGCARDEAWGGLRAELGWDGSLFSAEDAATLAGCLEALAESALAAPGREVGELRSSPRPSASGSPGSTPPPGPAGFRSSASTSSSRRRRPHSGAPALVFEAASSPTRELDRRANRLAAPPAAAWGSGRSRGSASASSARPDLVVALLAVLKAGGRLRAARPGLPGERLSLMSRTPAGPVLVTAGEASRSSCAGRGVARVRLRRRDRRGRDGGPAPRGATPETSPT